MLIIGKGEQLPWQADSFVPENTCPLVFNKLA
jgi:hypothetical protein